MKKFTILFALCVVLAIGVNAQEYKPFKVGLGLGYAIPGGEGSKGGVLFYAEPAYRVQDQLQLGLRMEFAAMARGASEDIGSTELEISTSGSYTLNGQYYFMNGGFRPFAGLGFGIYSLKAAEFTAGTTTGVVGKDESKFGFYPRVGFDAGHFQFTIDYNILGNTKIEGSDVEFKNSYIGIRAGVSIGGGRN